MIVMKREVYTREFIENGRPDTPDRAVWGSSRVGQRRKTEERGPEPLLGFLRGGAGEGRGGNGTAGYAPRVGFV